MNSEYAQLNDTWKGSIRVVAVESFGEMPTTDTESPVPFT